MIAVGTKVHVIASGIYRGLVGTVIKADRHKQIMWVRFDDASGRTVDVQWFTDANLRSLE